MKINQLIHTNNSLTINIENDLNNKNNLKNDILSIVSGYSVNDFLLEALLLQIIY